MTTKQTIHLTDEEGAALSRIVHKALTQDNLCTKRDHELLDIIFDDQLTVKFSIDEGEDE